MPAQAINRGLGKRTAGRQPRQRPGLELTPLVRLAMRPAEITKRKRGRRPLTGFGIAAAELFKSSIDLVVGNTGQLAMPVAHRDQF